MRYVTASVVTDTHTLTHQFTHKMTTITLEHVSGVNKAHHIEKLTVVIEYNV